MSASPTETSLEARPSSNRLALNTSIASDLEALRALDRPVFAVETPEGVRLLDAPGASPVLASAPPIPVERLGARSFRETHGVRAAYVAGAMAGGIGSARLVTAMAEAGLLAGFGAGGLDVATVDDALARLTRDLGPSRPFKVNLLHMPQAAELERRRVELFLARGVARISASGFMNLTPAVVAYRARGLSVRPDGTIDARTHILAKVSRPEVARAFLEPAPADLLARLVQDGSVTEAQARLAERVPVAEDITVEGDSGGHTDRRAGLPLLASIQALRDAIVEARRYERPVRVGAAGGIGTPSTVLAAFVAGADYVVTGSINQACVEAGTSDLVKSMLARADVSSVATAPAADMFELGVQVQVLKQGTLFVPRAERLHRLYSSYPSWDEIPAIEREDVEKTIFRRSATEVWADTRAYLEQREPALLAEAERAPKKKLALLFRWYLAMGSRWAMEGRAERKVDFQVWCGPIIGAFNRWTEGTPLAQPENRRVADVARALLEGAAALYRARLLALQGVELPRAVFTHLSRWMPDEPEQPQ